MSDQKQQRMNGLLAKVLKLQNQIDKKDNIDREKEEKLNTRRKILIGSYFMQKNDDGNFIRYDDFMKKEKFEQFLTKNADRELFGFDKYLYIPVGKGLDDLVKSKGAAFIGYKDSDKKIGKWQLQKGANFDEIQAEINRAEQNLKNKNDNNAGATKESRTDIHLN